MGFIELSKRVYYKLTQTYPLCSCWFCLGLLGVLCVAIVGSLSAFMIVGFLAQYVQLSVNHMLFASTHNFTNGCLLGVDSCDKITKMPFDIIGGSADEIGCIDFDGFFNVPCFTVGLYNVICIFVLISTVIMVINQIYYYCSDAVQIYQEEVVLEEVKMG